MSSLHQETFLSWMGGTLTMLYLSPINELLVYRDLQTDAPLPGLATRWQMSPDGKQWTFWLRQGIPFYEGWGELTGEDVKCAFERTIGEGSNASSASELRNLLDRIEVSEKFKVVFYLKQPSIDFPGSLAGDGSQQDRLQKVCGAGGR
jgi:ABC-type transport system substrate-binding protein